VTTQSINAFLAGARAVVISNNAPGPWAEFVLAVIDVPVVAVTGGVGDLLQAQGNPAVTVRVVKEQSTYLSYSGTSMACPHVAGVAGLLVSQFGASRVTVPLLRQALETTAEDLGAPGRDDLYGHGLVRADLARAFLLNALPPCAADFDASGAIDPDDLADFIAAFFSQPPDVRADFDGSGTIDPDDLADFIGAYFGGCA
jgi:hypothetical protein